MSRILYARLRNGSQQDFEHLKRRVSSGASRLGWNNPKSKRVRMSRDRPSIVAILHPSSTSHELRTGSVFVGHVESRCRWYEVGSGTPAGSYAICRSDGRVIELLSDAVGSRTLWYYIDDTMFIASTSQRWLATVLGTFELNRRALTWMLTTGTLGPIDGWDMRLHRLQADCTLTIDVATWTARLSHGDDRFEPAKNNRAKGRAALRDTLYRAFDDLAFDPSRWVLPLSGGYDSRGILCMLPRVDAIRTITWGTDASAEDPASDAAVAIRLAKAAGVPHEYLTIDSTRIPFDDVVDRFVANGEGRTDHIYGYLDGFAIWQELSSRGIEGIIRGDEGFGWMEVASHDEARTSVGLLLWEDFSNLPDLDAWGLAPQYVPDFLDRRSGESPSQWRDRLYHQYRIPTLLAALTDLKSSFVEVANPLLNHEIISTVRRLPDRMRTEKKLFKEIVEEISPDVPFAKTMSIADSRSVLRSPEVLQVLSDALTSHTARRMFPEPLLAHIMQGLHSEPSSVNKEMKPGMKNLLRALIPRSAIAAVRRFRPNRPMDVHTMALRACISCRAFELLTADASARLPSRTPEVKVH